MIEASVIPTNEPASGMKRQNLDILVIATEKLEVHSSTELLFMAKKLIVKNDDTDTIFPS